MLEAHGGLFAGLIDCLRGQELGRDADEDVGKSAAVTSLRNQNTNDQRNRSLTTLFKVTKSSAKQLITEQKLR